MKGPNMNELMKQAQKVQQDMVKAQEELKDLTVSAGAGGGAVNVTMNCALEVEKVEIDPSAVDRDDVEMLQDLVTAAVNEALRQAQEVASRKVGQAAGGFNLPGLGV